MGNACNTNQKRGLCVDKPLKMYSKSLKRGTRNKFKFVLDDEDLLISPTSITTNVESITSPTLTVPNTFTFDNKAERDNTLDIWVQTLCQNHSSIEGKQQDSDSDGTSSLMQQVKDDLHGIQLHDDTNTAHSAHSHSEFESSDSDENKPNLYRPNTRSRWDTKDIEPLQDDMKQQLLHLVSAHSPISNVEEEMNSTNEMMKAMDDDEDKLVYLGNIGDIGNIGEPSFMKRGSSVIRTLSHDWDSEDMENHETQMRKHLSHLANEHSILNMNDGEVNRVNDD